MLKQRFKKRKDDEWTPSPSQRPTKDKTGTQFIIHCTDSTDELVTLPSLDSFKSLLEVARVRCNPTLINIAASLKEGELQRI